MLLLPETGFQPSPTRHNVKLDILVDWLEGSVAFVDEDLSQNDVVDALIENEVYSDQDCALTQVSDAWEERDRRAGVVFDGAPFEVTGRRINRKCSWNENPAYSFCLLLSLHVLFKTWAKDFGSDYTVQGDLFERLTVECLDQLGWTTYRTGWTPGNAKKIKQVVADVSDHLRESEQPGAVDKWIGPLANEEGLDVVCSDPFNDGWGGRPLFFFQCASGANWIDKLHTPHLGTWQKVIDFTTNPQRGFSIPFALLEHKFRKSALRVNGMFLDRFRLLSPSVEGDIGWTSKPLAQDILRWMRPRVKKLPDDRT